MSWLSRALHSIASWRKHHSVDDLLNDSRWMIKRLEKLAERKIIEAQTHVSSALWANELAEHARAEAERATKSVGELKRMYGIPEPEPEMPEAANLPAIVYGVTEDAKTV
jgi:hypothetical protein